MSSYPDWWNYTITVYNKYEDPATRLTSWYRKVITGCYWSGSTLQILKQDFAVETDSAMCRIPKQDNYVDKASWNNLSSDDKLVHLTFAPGDIVALGTVTDEIDDFPTESTTSIQSTAFLKKYANTSFVVKNFTDNSNEYKGSQHYCVRGV
jgi:hypothetical protein